MQLTPPQEPAIVYQGALIRPSSAPLTPEASEAFNAVVAGKPRKLFPPRTLKIANRKRALAKRCQAAGVKNAAGLLSR
jgi:hypothetical protein